MIVIAIERKSIPQKDVSRLLRVQPKKLAPTYDMVHRNTAKANEFFMNRNREEFIA